MNTTLIIQITNQSALGIIHEIEELHLIKVLRKNPSLASTKLSDKYKGTISKEQAASLNEHIKKMRSG